jgi:hypothetical protein
VEVDRLDVDGEMALVADDDRRATTRFSLSSAFERVVPALSLVLKRIHDVTPTPDELTITMGFKIGGETGLIFTKGTTEAVFGLSATWRKKPIPDISAPPAAAAGNGDTSDPPQT